MQDQTFSQMQPELSDLDEFTGLETHDFQEKTLRVDLQKVISQAQSFHEMTQTKGWRLLREFLENQVKTLTEQLKVEVEYEKIRRIQSEILAFESIFKIVDKSFEDSLEAQKQLLEMTAPQFQGIS